MATITSKQSDKINQMQCGNPSMLPIDWAFFSNGDISLKIRWKWNPDELYLQTIDQNGQFVGDGFGPIIHTQK